jgi:hypothetical protein
MSSQQDFEIVKKIMLLHISVVILFWVMVLCNILYGSRPTCCFSVAKYTVDLAQIRRDYEHFALGCFISQLQYMVLYYSLKLYFSFQRLDEYETR